MTYYHAIVIDDDSLVHMTWQFAAKKLGKEILLFFDPREFIKIAAQVDANSPVYIDSSLTGGQRGEVVAKEIYDLGFHNISIISGYEPSHFPPLSQMPWVKAILGKDPVL